MIRIVADKIASSTIRLGLRKDLWLSESIECMEGAVVAVRILNSKSSYNTLELPTGRFAALKPGDIVVGVLGFRNALHGYSGVLPTVLQPGDTVQVLNLGGVLGKCTSCSPLVGEPFQAEVLGQVLTFPELGSRKGTPANIKDFSLSLQPSMPTPKAPVIGVVGTCMNSGKTEACLALIQQLVHRGLKVAAGKATGVSLRKDVLAMEDAGACTGRIFTDFGIVTTSDANADSVACALVAELDSCGADVIVLELGDGLMGQYGVDKILSHPDLNRALSLIALAANDPVGAWGGVEWLQRQHGLAPTVITGPVTDHEAGTNNLRSRLAIPAFNARTQSESFASVFLDKVLTYAS